MKRHHTLITSLLGWQLTGPAPPPIIAVEKLPVTGTLTASLAFDPASPKLRVSRLLNLAGFGHAAENRMDRGQ
jgi:hypothetical protein